MTLTQCMRTHTQNVSASIHSYKTIHLISSMGIDNETSGGFRAGTFIKVTIHFDTEKEVSATGIAVAFSGVENSVVKYFKVIGNHIMSVKASAMRNIYQVTIPVNTSTIIHNGKVLLGKYVIRVIIKLPQRLPGSMMGATYIGSHCNVQYNLTAQLVGSGKDQDYKANKEVHVVAPLYFNFPIPYHKPPTQKKVHFCCCFRCVRQYLYL